jgi:hypothetical protein
MGLTKLLDLLLEGDACAMANWCISGDILLVNVS